MNNVYIAPILIIRLETIHHLSNFSFFHMSKWTLLSPGQSLNEFPIFTPRTGPTILISYGRLMIRELCFPILWTAPSWISAVWQPIFNAFILQLSPQESLVQHFQSAHVDDLEERVNQHMFILFSFFSPDRRLDTQMIKESAIFFLLFYFPHFIFEFFFFFCHFIFLFLTAINLWHLFMWEHIFVVSFVDRCFGVQVWGTPWPFLHLDVPYFW